MSQLETVNYSVANRVATIELNRPASLNAFNQQLRLDLLVAIESAEIDDEVRVVVISGAGKGFSAGADLNNVMAGYDTIEEQLLAEYKPFLMKIADSKKIYLASVRGPAAGIGGALMMTCDLAVMSENSYIYQAFATIGLLQDGAASWHLVNTLGYKRAFQLVVESEKLVAADCLALGLTNKVVADDELASYTQQWAERLTKGAPLAQQYIKETLHKAQRIGLSEAFDLEANRQHLAISSQDHQEGVKAFFDKRKPDFKGC